MSRIIFSTCFLFAIAASLPAAQLESAKVTVAVNKVQIAPSGQSPKPAGVGDVLAGKATLETGESSRAELTFNDQTIARIGANSVFSFFRGTRELELNQGVIFMQVPKNAGGATIQTAAVTAAITGTTIAIEYSKAKGNGPGAVKILVLEGTLRVYLKSRPGESILLTAGQMIDLDPDATSLPEPKIFDIERLVRTSKLLGEPFAPLASLPLIVQSIASQEEAKKKGTLLVSNYVLHAEIPGGVANFQQNNSVTTLRVLAVPAPTPVPRVVVPPPYVPPPTPPPTPRPTPVY